MKLGNCLWSQNRCQIAKHIIPRAEMGGECSSILCQKQVKAERGSRHFFFCFLQTSIFIDAHPIKNGKYFGRFLSKKVVVMYVQQLLVRQHSSRDARMYLGQTSRIFSSHWKWNWKQQISKHFLCKFCAVPQTLVVFILLLPITFLSCTLVVLSLLAGLPGLNEDIAI